MQEMETDQVFLEATSIERLLVDHIVSVQDWEFWF